MCLCFSGVLYLGLIFLRVRTIKPYTHVGKHKIWVLLLLHFLLSQINSCFLIFSRLNNQIHFICMSVARFSRNFWLAPQVRMLETVKPLSQKYFLKKSYFPHSACERDKTSRKTPISTSNLGFPITLFLPLHPLCDRTGGKKSSKALVLNRTITEDL